MISQIELFCDVIKCLERQGITTLLTRQTNAIIKAVDMIIAELDRPEKKVSPGMGLYNWLDSDGVGASSKFMASVLSKEFDAPYAYPHDPGDFGRCLGLLEACPEYNMEIHRMKETSREWGALISEWDELKRLYWLEYPGFPVPLLYKKMHELIKEKNGT